MPKRMRQPGIADGTEGVAAEAQKPSGTGSKSSRPSIPSSSRKSTNSALLRAAQKAKAISEPVKANRNKIVVAVDFGTTYSGVAFVTTTNSDARDIQVIVDWVGAARKNDHLEKVPSRIAFAFENDGLASDKWGYEVEPSMKSYAWTKLLLDSDAMQTAFDSDVLSRKLKKGLFELPNDMTAEEVVTAYLKHLYKHTIERLIRTYSGDILKVTTIDFWFTHPATWQESANDATRYAATEAGFGSRPGDELYMITEPEAAAMAILTQAIDKNPGLYKVMTNVLIADLGGGTLDFQCLTIEKLDPLRTEETIPGLGGKSGSTYIDCNFHDWLDSTFGEAFTKLPVSKTGIGSRFMEDFELVKKTFIGKDLKKTYQIHLPALGKALRDRRINPNSYDFEEFNVLVSGIDLQIMFQPILDKAFALIHEQVTSLRKEKKPIFKVLCLCGGLGQSEYVWLKFQEYCDDTLDGKCQLVTDERAWSAVVRGAAVRGLDGSMVLSKKAKQCYGIGVHQEFREDYDREEDSFICPIKGKRADGYVDWVVKRGHRFAPNFRAESKLYVPIEEEDDEEDMVFFWDLYACAEDEASIRVDDKCVKHVGKIKLELAKSYKRQETNGNSRAEAVPIKIVFELGNDRGVLAVKAMHNKTVVGEAKIDYTRSNVRRAARSAGLL